MSLRDDVRIFKALSDEKRLAVLNMLKKGELCTCYLLRDLNINQSTLSHHMKILCDIGLVDSRKVGTWIYYKISDSGKKQLESLVHKYTSFEQETTKA